MRVAGDLTVDANTNDRPNVIASSGVNQPSSDNGGGGSGTPSSFDFDGSAALAYGDYTNTATSTISSGAIVDVGQKLAVTSEALNDFQFTYGVNLYTALSQEPTFKTDQPGADDVTLNPNDIVEVEPGFAGTGNVGDWYQYLGGTLPNVNLTTQNYSNLNLWNHLHSGWENVALNFLQNFNTYLDNSFGADNNLFDTWSQATSNNGDTPVAVAGSLTCEILNQTSNASIGTGVQINQDTDSTYRTGTQSVFVLATGTNSSLNAGGSVQTPGLSGSNKQLQIGVNAPGAGVQASNASVGAAFVLVLYTDNVTATISSGVNLFANSLDVDAETAVFNFSIMISGGTSNNFGFVGVLSVVDLNDTTLAQIASGATIDVGSNDVVEPLPTTPANTIPAFTTDAILANELPGTTGTDSSGNPTDTVSASTIVQAHDLLDLFNYAGGIMAGTNSGVGASVGVNTVTRDTEAYIGDPSTSAGNGSVAVLHSGGPVIVDAQNNGQVDTGALAASKVAPGSSAGSNSSYGVGISGDVSYDQVTDTTLAYLHNAVASAPGVNVNSANKTEFIAISGSFALVLNNGTSTGIAGSYTQNTIGGATSAFLDNANVILTTGYLFITAATTGETYSLSASGSLVTSGQGIAIAGQVSLNSIGITTDAEVMDHSVITAGPNNIYLSGTDNNYIFAISGSLAYGGRAGIGAAIATNTVNDTADASIDESTVPSAYAVSLTGQNVSGGIFSITVGGAGAQTFALGGAVSTNNVNNTNDAEITGGSNVTAANSVTLSSGDNPTIEAIAGGIAGSGQAAIGAAIATNTIGDKTESHIDGSTVTSGTVTLGATSTASIESLTIGGAGSGTFSLGGAIGLDTIDDTTESYITGGATVTASQGLSLTATDTPSITAGAGALDGSGTAAISAGIATNDIGDVVKAYIDGGSMIQTGSLTETATETATLEAASLGAAGGGSVAIAGGIGINDITDNVDAHIAGGTTAVSTGDISLTAQDTSSNSSLTGQASVAGATGIGAAVSYNEIGNTITAYISSSNVTSTGGSVYINAVSTPTIDTSCAGLSGGLAGIAGSVAVNVLQSGVTAYIVGSIVNAFANILVSAQSTDILQVIAGTLAAGAAGIGGTVVINTIADTTFAYVDGSTVTAAGQGPSFNLDYTDPGSGNQLVENFKGLAVVASSTETPNTNGLDASVFAVNLAFGLAGIGGVVAVTSLSDITQAYIAGSRVNSSAQEQGGVFVQANSYDYMKIIPGSLGGGVVGVGGAVARTDDTSQTSAFISSSNGTGTDPYPTQPSVVFGSSVQVSAVSSEQFEVDVVGSTGGLIAVAGSVAVTTINTGTVAFVRDSSIFSQGEAAVLAYDNAEIDPSVGALAGSAVGVAGSVSVNTIENTVLAQVFGGDMTAAGSINVMATSIDAINPYTGTISAAAIALAGAVSVDTIQTTTEADVENGTSPAILDQDGGPQSGGVTISATDQADLSAKTGSVSAGAVGVGASIDVGAIRNRTVAQVGPQTRITSSAGVNVTATSNRSIASDVVAFAGGGVALSGAVSVISLGASTDPTAENQFDVQNGGTDLLQQTDQNIATPSLTTAINYQTTGTAPAATQAGTAVIDLGQPSIDADLTAAAGADRVTGAFIDPATDAAQAASISASGAINVTSSNTYDVQQTTGDANLGPVAIGAAVSVATVQTNTQAVVGSYASLTSGGAITIQATDQDSEPMQITGIAGSGAIVGAVANVATLNFTSDTSTQVGNNAVILGEGNTAVTVAAGEKGLGQIQAQGYAAGGVVAISGADTTANFTPDVTAQVGDGATVGTPLDPVSSLTVSTLTTNTFIAAALAGSGGAGAAGSGQSAANLNPTGSASIGAASVQSTGAVAVSDTSIETVTSASNEITPGIVLGAGSSNSLATIGGSQSANIAGNASIGAASLAVNAESTDTATSIAQAFGTGVVTGAAASANSDVNVNTLADIGAATIVLSAGATVTSTSKDTATANTGKLPTAVIGAGNFGLLAYGSATSNATIRSITKAYITGATITTGEDLTVSSTGTDSTTANAYGLPIGLLYDGLENIGNARTAPETDAWISGSAVGSGGNVAVTADAQTSAAADVFAGSAGLVTAGVSHSNATDSPNLSAYVGAGSMINAVGNIRIEATHTAVDGTGAKAIADSPSVGVVGEDGADPTATSGAILAAYVSPGSVLDAAGNIALDASSNNTATSQASSLFGGLLGAGTSNPTTTIDGQTMVNMDGTIAGAAMVTVSAESTSLGVATGVSGSTTLVGGVGVTTQTTVTPETEASIGDNSTPAAVLASGNVTVTSESTDTATANASGGDAGVVALGVVTATATLSPAVQSFVGAGSTIDSTGGSVSLVALHNYDQNGNVIPDQGATANGSGAGGDKSLDVGVVSINSLAPTATANASVATVVSPGATIIAGQNVSLLSQSDNTATSTAGILDFGVVGYGGVSSVATASGTTGASLSEVAGLVAGGNLSAIALGTGASTANATADGGGAIDINASSVAAHDSPSVTASLGSTTPVSVGGNTTIEGLALGNAYSDAEGGGGGVIQVGTSFGEASWIPTIEAVVTAGTVLHSGGNVNILAYDNANQAGTPDSTREAYSRATATGGGFKATEAAQIIVTDNSTTDAHVGAGASISAGQALNVIASSLDQADGFVDGTAGGFGNYGSTDGVLFMSSQTQAGTDDATGSAPTFLSAGKAINISSTTTDNGSPAMSGAGGGAVGSGGANLTLTLVEPPNGPMTQARLGNNTTVDAPSATLVVLAQENNNLSAVLNQTTIGAIESNTGNATAAAGTTTSPLETLAELGIDDDVNVGQFDLHADDANLSATVSDKTESDGGAVSDNATAEADEITDARTDIGGGSTVTAATSLNVLASAENDDTNSYSKTTVLALGAIYDSTAGSNKFVTTEADFDFTTELAAPEISIVAARPPQTGGSTYVVDADKTAASLNPGIDCSQNNIGSEVITNTVTLNSNFTLTGSVLHTLNVNPAGTVTAENGLAVTDGTNPLGIGQTDTTGQIDVTALSTGTASTLTVSAPGGTTSGTSSIVFDSNGTVTIQNASANDLYVAPINVVGAGGTPTITDTATNANWSYITSTSIGGGFVQIANTNTTGGNIHLSGAITNPLGATVITSAGGSVLATGAGDSIESQTFDLEADQGTLGTPQVPLPLVPLFTAGVAASLSQAIGSAGVYLAVAPVSQGGGPINLSVSGVSSASGNVSLLFEDGQTNGSPTPDTITIQSVAAGLGNVSITAGSSSAVASNVVLSGPIFDPAGSTTITSPGGNISSAGAAQLISAQTVSLTASKGSIGASSPIVVDLDPVQLNAAAQGNINVTAIGGALIAGVVTSTAGKYPLDCRHRDPGHRQPRHP